MSTHLCASEFPPTQSSRRLTDLPASLNSRVVGPFLSLGRDAGPVARGRGHAAPRGESFRLPTSPETAHAPEVWFLKASQSGDQLHYSVPEEEEGV